MPTHFLDLPREIRDEIYGYVFATTGLIEVVAVRYDKKDPIRTSSSNAPLVLKQKTFNSDNEAVQVVNGAGEVNISLTLMSTCWQIYQETRPYFWSRNTFYFDTLAAPQGSLTTLVDPRKLFKSMGQYVSRLVTSITFNMPADAEGVSHLPRVLGYLSSRSRRGDFKRLELVCTMNTKNDLDQLNFGRVELVKILAKGKSGCRYERIIRMPRTIPQWDERSISNTAEKVHIAFGGKLFWGDILGWEKYERRGSPLLV